MGRLSSRKLSVLAVVLSVEPSNHSLEIGQTWHNSMPEYFGMPLGKVSKAVAAAEREGNIHHEAHISQAGISNADHPTARGHRLCAGTCPGRHDLIGTIVYCRKFPWGRRGRPY